MNNVALNQMFTPHPDVAHITPHRGSARRLIRLTPILALLLTSTFSFVSVEQALAGYYELLEGKGLDVCEAYERNLNSFKPRFPFRCDRPVNPEFEEFTKPVFRDHESLPPEQVVPGKVVKQVERFLWERDANPVYYFPVTEWPQWHGTKEQYALAWRNYEYDRQTDYTSRSGIAEIDIDNDGIPDTVYRDGQCRRGSLLLVLSPERTDLDRAKTELVMPHPARKAQGFGEFRPVKRGDFGVPPSDIKRGYAEVEDSLHEARYDVFRYKGHTYFDLWWIRHPSYQGKEDIYAGRLHVYTIHDQRTREVCNYRYQYTD